MLTFYNCVRISGMGQFDCSNKLYNATAINSTTIDAKPIDQQQNTAIHFQSPDWISEQEDYYQKVMEYAKELRKKANITEPNINEVLLCKIL